MPICYVTVSVFSVLTDFHSIDQRKIDSKCLIKNARDTLNLKRLFTEETAKKRIMSPLHCNTMLRTDRNHWLVATSRRNVLRLKNQASQPVRAVKLEFLKRKTRAEIPDAGELLFQHYHTSINFTRVHKSEGEYARISRMSVVSTDIPFEFENPQLSSRPDFVPFIRMTSG